MAVFGDRGLCCGEIHDGLVGGVGGDERGDGEVVDRSGVTAGALIDRSDGVIRE